MDISTEDIKGFVARVEKLAEMAFQLDMEDPYTEDNMDYFHHDIWLLMEYCFGISPNDMKAKYKVEKV
jgi:hypothetical protein